MSAPMTGLRRQIGGWSLMVEGTLSLNARWESEPRGDAGAFFTNAMMVAGRRALGPALVELRAMASAEPAMGPSGYPLLFQTGETADGINPLVDRQHPHDALMELSASMRAEFEPGAWAFLYLAPVGSPALGPVPYMHRLSGLDNPVTPVSHHFLDASHISYGVVTAGMVVDARVQLELSLFNAHEPDQERWVPQAPSLNSLSGRVTWMPGGDWALQASFADLKEPEQLHPAIDVYRLTVSATHFLELGRGFWSSTAAWGSNVRPRTTMTLGEARRRLTAPLLAHYLNVGSLPPGADDSLLLVFERRQSSAVLLESTLRWRGTTGFVRFESAVKDELFPPTDLRHSELFRVSKWNVGVVQDFAIRAAVKVGLGVAASVHFAAGALESAYGSRPGALTLFTRLRL